MRFPKEIVFKSRKYLDWVKTRKCLCKYHQGEPVPANFPSYSIFFNIIDPHHTEGRNRDDRTVPLCRWSHSLTESLAPSDWEREMGFTEDRLKEEAIILREEYLKGENHV